MRKKITQKDILRAQEIIKCKYDIIYWAEKYVKLPAVGGDKTPVLYDPQKRVLKSFYDDHFLVLLKSRQTGFSTLCQIIMAHLGTFYDNCVMGIVSRDGPEASDYNRKALDIIHKLPKWMQPKFEFENAQSFKTKRGSQLWSSAISPANPGAVFRGKSISTLVLDEAAHTRYIDEAYTGIGPALSKAQKDARDEGVPFGTIIVSTPNKKSGTGQWYFDRWSEAISNPNGLWKPHRVYWKEVDAFKNDPNWYKQQCEILNNDKNKILQELELKFVDSGEGIFDEKVQLALQDIKSEPQEIIKVNEYSDLFRFLSIERGHSYLIGCDTASEFGADASTIEVLDAVTMEQVFEFKGHLSVTKFAEVIKFVAKLIPKHLLLIENNSYGNQVCEVIYNNSDSFQYNVYGAWKKVPVPDQPRQKRTVFIPGINTNTHTRPLIFDALYEQVSSFPNMIASDRLALELVSLVDKKNKVEASSGCHDDLAMAYAFCCYAKKYLKEALPGQIIENSNDVEDTMDTELSWVDGLNNPMPRITRNNTSIDSLNKATHDLISQNYEKLVGQDMGKIDINKLFKNVRKGII